ncbi:protocadherin-like wing polarity protein stan isoform X3 [Folsomia candida]|uniref:protocadherin-like wing polarity protein stan isoform X3 n=1 Tax=Folsomia candida TaxID=158441 RepID=UPI0016051CFC|nr:protocadherin-like wing polarity protein stan isoform X3 [Folsomia candida]
MGLTTSPWKLAIPFLIVISLKSGEGFVVVADQNRVEGWILFDSQIQLPPPPPDAGGSSYNTTQWHYQYRISYHKTQPWVHRLLRLDSDGQLMFRRNYAHKCQLSHIFPSTFIVYVDIVAKSALGQKQAGEHEEDSLQFGKSPAQLKNELARQFYDCISFPITVILKESNECNQNSPVGTLSKEGASTSTGESGNELTSISRTVDDIYVALPINWDDRCFHSSEKIGNVYDFLPSSVKAQCGVKASVSGDEHTWGVQASTNDIVLRRDWCLFEPGYHTIQLVLHLNCSTDGSLLPESVMSWDQMVHLILHSGGGGGSLMDFHPIHRIRREMQNQSPFFDQPLYIASVPEEQPPGITVTTITASDPENSPLSYSMTSLLDARSQQFFALDPKSGIVTTVEKLDRERMDVHYFRIVATDSGIPPRTGTGTLQILVSDYNDWGPLFEHAAYSVSVREGLSVGDTVLSVRATDQDTDKNGDIHYSILNPHDIDDTFRIDPNSGVITTKLALDREKRDEYTLIIQASDLAPNQVDRKSATATVRVEILDDNDNWPQWTQRLYNVSIPENVDVSNYPVIARVSATDADEGVNSALRYSIIGGNTQNIFSIDSLTGEISLTKSLDYESTRSYRLNVRAIDAGNPTRSNNTILAVMVEDQNDSPPRFYSQIFQETVLENLPLQSSVLRIQAFDPDDGDNAKIYYRLSYRESTEKFPFDIEPDSGWIKTNRELDREEQFRYDFEVIAADSGNVPLSATASVVILVLDSNDNNPTFDPKLYENQVSELDAPGTPVVTVKATDPDENSRLTYEIAEGNVRSRFSITTQNGEGIITIAQPLDFKSERKYVLTIRVTDSGGKSDLATVYVEVSDANTNPPQFQNTPYSVKIFEDVPIGTTVLNVLATDQDSGLNAQIIYTFVNDGGDNDVDNFMIDSTTGAITTSQLLDREKVPGYILTVNARDRGIPPLSDTTDVEIVLNDVNDLQPTFEREYYHAKIDEDVPVGSSIMQVAASDGDVGKNSIIRFSFSTFSDGDGTFSVDPASGIIRTIKPLDREAVGRYDLMVLATDQGTPPLSGKTNVTIAVQDKNDSPPQFESDRIRLFIQENSPIGSVVGTLKASDQDEGQNAQIIFSIVGGVDANSFTLNSHPQPTGGGIGGDGSEGTAATASADILTRIELDYESPRKKFDIIVRAASPPLRNDVHVEIHLVDTNDNAPMIKNQFHIILNNYKDQFPVGAIGQVPAVDADISDKLHYTIVSGNKANLVYLDPNGMITLSPFLDSNVPLHAKMEIVVSDGLNEVRSEMIISTRMITDELLFNSVTIQLADMTTEAFLSPLFNHFLQAVAVILNVPKENIVIFSVQEEIEGTRGTLNVSLSARRPSSSTSSEEYFSPDYIKERVFLNRLTLSKLAIGVDVLPFSDDLCLQEPCLNFEECLVVLKFRNVSNFVATESMLFRSVHPWQTFSCRCGVGFTGLREHYLCDAEINLCFSSPCTNGGTCYQREGGYSCVCPPGTTGKQCQIQLELDTCQPNICSSGSSCTPRLRGGFLCQNCTRGEYVNSLCELTARSFSRGSFLIFPGLKDRVRLHLEISFASQQKNGLLMYNGRFQERYDFIALEIVNSVVRFSFSLGSNNVTVVETGSPVSDGLWHTVRVEYFNKTATLSLDNCDVIVTLENPDEFPPAKSCAGRGLHILEDRCSSLTESCQRFLDLTGPLYIGGLPTSNSPNTIQTHDFVGCVKNVFINYKFVDMNNYIMEMGTNNGCPEKNNFCASYPCKNGGKCIDGWTTYACQCNDGWGQKDCSEDAKPVWNLRDDSSHISFTPQLRQIQFPWYNSISLRTLKKSGKLMAIKLSNNESLSITLDDGLVHYYYNEQSIPVTLPKINDGHWHNIEAKWMTAEIWFSLDYGQFEVTVPFEAKMQNLHVTTVVIGSSAGGSLPESSMAGCVQDVRVGSAKNYLRKTESEKGVNEGCSLAAACVGAICPQRSTCVEEGGRHKCQCDPGYVGDKCVPICSLKMCKNNGTCIMDLTTERGYRCQCDDRLFLGDYCEKQMELSCPSTWWGWPICGPCSCPADKNFSPDCNKKTGQCRCKEYHYEKDGVCKDCLCYGTGSVSKNCDPDTGKCQCRAGVVGTKCDSCLNSFAEVTTKGCEVVRDGCPRAFSSEVWWPRTKFNLVSVHDCPNGAVGLATRSCSSEGWNSPDLFNCTSNSFISIVNTVSQLDSKDLPLAPLLSTKLAADLTKALNISHKLYGNDLWISLRMLTHLIVHETKQSGLNLSHRQDKNFIKNIITSVGKVTSKEYVHEWNRLRRTYGSGSDSLLALMEKYLAHLVLNQEDTFTKPFEILSNNMIMGLDTVELTWENEGRKNFEDLVVESNYDLYEVTSTTKRAVRFPKYDNIVMDPRRYPKGLKIIIPLDILGLQDEKDMAGNAVVGFTEYYSLWDVLPKKFMNDVDRRFNSELVASPPVVSLAILASRQGLVSGRQTTPVRLIYEIFGRYIDSSNPQCVVWQEPTGLKQPFTGFPTILDDSSSDDGGWTSRPCQTQVEEQYISKSVGNMMTVNCTCWHLSTFAVLIENNDTQDIPRAGQIEDIVTYVSFVVALTLIFGALIGLGILQGPVPSTITNTIHKHLLLSIFSALLFYLIALKLRLILVANDNLCRALAIGLHATWLATFSWLFGSAIHLRRMFTEVRDVNHGSSLFYFALGYAFPLLCVALSLGVRAHHYGNRFFCWLSLYEGIVWGMVGPILVCVLATLFIFLLAVRAAFTLKDQVVDSGNMRTLLWMDLTLLPICGMVWALCLLGANERSAVWQFAIAVAVAILSIYVALGYCILNKRVKDSFMQRLGVHEWRHETDRRDRNSGALFRSRDPIAQQNASRSALVYRTDLGVAGRDDPRKKDMFRNIRSGVSTASTTSRSTTKTSSSPYGYGATLPHYRVKYGDEVDRKHHGKRRKRSNSDDDGSSDGERTLELASSHSSDEDEATTVHGPVRSATLAAEEEGDDHSSQHSHQGQPNQSSSYHPMYAQQQKELNSQNLGHGHGQEQGKSASFVPQGFETVNDLSGTASPSLSTFGRISSPAERWGSSYGMVSGPGRPLAESSPLQERPPHPQHLSSFHPTDDEINTDELHGGGQVNRGLEMDTMSGDEDEDSSPQYHQAYRHHQPSSSSHTQNLSSHQQQQHYLYDYPRHPSVQVVPPLSSNEEGSYRVEGDRPHSSTPAPPPHPHGEDEDDDNSDAYDGSIVAGVLV